MTRTFRGVALAFVLVLGGALAACSDDKQDAPTGTTSTDDRPTVEVTAQPQDPQLAQVTAEQVFDNMSDGDWAGAWELWSDSAKTAIAKDAFVELVPTCTGLQGEYVLTGLTPVDDSTATVKWSRTPTGGAAASGSSTVKYQNGMWRFEPDAPWLAAFKQNRCP